MQSIENNICQAIDIIVDRAVAKAKYDKTIVAKVIFCIDSSIGKYKVKYQDNIWDAYSSDFNVTYEQDTNVYVLIPEGDFRKDKVIIGAIRKEKKYFDVIDKDSLYLEVGESCIELENGADNEYKLSSYQDDEIILYQKNGNEYENFLKVNEESLKYIRENKISTIKCKANFKTVLNEKQQYSGNYGIIFNLEFKNEDESSFFKDYIFEVKDMQGTPYLFFNGSQQYKIFNIDDIDKFYDINSIKIFVKNFPKDFEGVNRYQSAINTFNNLQSEYEEAINDIMNDSSLTQNEKNKKIKIIRDYYEPLLIAANKLIIDVYNIFISNIKLYAVTKEEEEEISPQNDGTTSLQSVEYVKDIIPIKGENGYIIDLTIVKDTLLIPFYK